MDNAHVLEFFNNLWGLGTEPSCRTGPVAYVAWRKNNVSVSENKLASTLKAYLSSSPAVLLWTSLDLSPLLQEF